MTRSDSCGERRRSALRRCNGESPRHRLKRFVDLASQMFELTKRKAFTYAVNHLRWREVGLFSRECHRAFRAVFPMRVFANNVSLLFVFRRFAHLNTLNDSNGPVKLLEHGHSTPAPKRDEAQPPLTAPSCAPNFNVEVVMCKFARPSAVRWSAWLGVGVKVKRSGSMNHGN